MRRLSKSRINLEELIKKIDIYSLGIQIPLLFIQYSVNIGHENNKVIQDFLLFIQEMCPTKPPLTRLHQKKHLKIRSY